MIALLLWLILLVLAWPVAILVLVLYPILWVLMACLRVFAAVTAAVLHVALAIFGLPFRLLNARPHRRQATT